MFTFAAGRLIVATASTNSSTGPSLEEREETGEGSESESESENESESGRGGETRKEKGARAR
jgi:hypothetical protein